MQDTKDPLFTNIDCIFVGHMWWMSTDKEFDLLKHGQTSDSTQLIESGLSLWKIA